MSRSACTLVKPLADSHCSTSSVLVLAGSIPASLAQTTYERLLARLAGRSVRAVVDATRNLLVNVLPYQPFLIKPNNHELSEIAGVPLESDEEITAAARDLQAKGARNVLVSMAGDGALLLDENGGVHRIGCPKGKVVNSMRLLYAICLDVYSKL